MVSMFCPHRATLKRTSDKRGHIAHYLYVFHERPKRRLEGLNRDADSWMPFNARINAFKTPKPLGGQSPIIKGQDKGDYLHERVLMW